MANGLSSRISLLSLSTTRQEPYPAMKYIVSTLQIVIPTFIHCLIPLAHICVMNIKFKLIYIV